MNSIFEELTEINTLLTSKDVDVQDLFASQIGKQIFVIKVIIKDTYPNESKSADIDDLLKTMMIRCTILIGRTVKLA